MGFSRLALLLTLPILTSASPALSFTQFHAFVYSHGVFTTLPDPQFGIVPLPLGISDDGRIVGTDGRFQGVLYEMGHFSALAFPPQGNDLAQPTGINDSGQIVGSAFNEIDVQRVAFYYNGVTYQFINPVFAKGGAVATGINNGGQIVGYYTTSTTKFEFVGFLKNGNSYSNVSDPLGTSTFPLGIDDLGQILGYYTDGAIDHGFVDSGGVFTTIDDPSATDGTIVYGTNHVGAVAGTYFDAVPHGPSIPHGFIEENGNYMTLDDPLGTLGTVVTGINFGGDVVGYFTASVPEPSTWAMMLVGFAGPGFARYRRTKKNAKALAAA